MTEGGTAKKAGKDKGGSSTSFDQKSLSLKGKARNTYKHRQDTPLVKITLEGVLNPVGTC